MSFHNLLSILDDIEEDLNEEVRIVALNLLNGLTLRTPVDSGRARGNWNVSPSESPNRSVDESRRADQARAEGTATINSVISQGDFPTITISNNLPYIEKLNDGSSLQAPKKFVEMVINRVTR